MLHLYTELQLFILFRKYNSALSFVSMGSNIVKPPGIGPYCFKVQGAVYHFAGPLHPSTESSRKYAQLYILDPGKH